LPAATTDVTSAASSAGVDRQGGMIGRPARAVDARLQPHLLHLLL
jgi:hypothetical protein